MPVASIDTWLGAVASLIVVPLTFVTLYLRSLREHQVNKHRELVQRVDRLESAVDRLTHAMAQTERDLTTKEEWLREAMHTRHRLERLVEAVVRVETTLYGAPGGAPARRGELYAPDGRGGEG